MTLLIQFLIALILAWISPAPEAAGVAAAVQDGVLAGPAVKASAPAKRTIVERGFDGALVELEDEPEVVAVFRLDLNPQERQALDAVAAKRSQAFDALVKQNYAAIVDSGAELRAMRDMAPEARRAALAKFRSVTAAMQPFTARGSFIDEAKDVLTAEQATEAKAMGAQWRTARTLDVRGKLAGESAPESAAAPDERLRIRFAIEDFGKMVRRSIERRANFARAQFEDLVKQLDLSPEQAEQVRALFMQRAVQEIQGTREAGMSMRERNEVFGELAKILDERQRGLLRDRILGQDGAPVAPAQPRG